MITIKSFSKKNKTTNSGGGSNTVITASTDSKVLDTHLLWGNEFNGTQDVNGSITSTGNVTAVKGIFSNSVDTPTVNTTDVLAENVETVDLDTNNLTATNGTVTTLQGNTATYNIANITNGNIDNIVNDYLEGGEADFSVLHSDTGDITTLSGNTSTYTNINGTNGNITNIESETLQSDEGTITELSGTSITYDEAALRELLSENIVTENLTVTKSAHFFELIIDKIKSAGGSVLLTPADGFKCDLIKEQTAKNCSNIKYGNGEGTNDNLENYIIPLDGYRVELETEGEDYYTQTYAANENIVFEYTAQTTGTFLFYAYNSGWSNTTYELSNDGGSTYRTISPNFSNYRRIPNGVYTSHTSSQYRVGSYLIKAGQKFRFTGTNTASRTLSAMVVPNKWGTDTTIFYNNIEYEVNLNNPNLYHLNSTSNTNQRKRLMYASGAESSTYGNANIWYISPYIDVADVTTIDLKLSSCASSGANLCAYDENLNYIQSNSLNYNAVTTTWTKATGTRYIRFTARWDYAQEDTEHPNGYYVYLNGNRTQPQTVKFLYMGYMPFSNINSLKVHVDFSNNHFKTNELTVINGLPCADWNGNGGIYNTLDDKFIWGDLDHYTAENIDDHTNLGYFGTGLYWKATDGDRAISNMWKVNDQAICETFNNANVGTNYNVSNKYYWALVTAVGTETIDGTDYHYITLDSNTCDGTLNPEVGDEIAMLGYRGTDDSSRQSAIYVAAYNSIDTGITAPLIAQYEGINDFNLSNHRITWFAKNSNEVKGNLKVIVDGQTKTVQELVESEKQSILSITDSAITAAVTESKAYTDGRETVLRSYIQTTADNVLLSANSTSQAYTDGVATTLRGEISVSADEITSTVSKKISGSNIFLYNSSSDGWRTTNTTYPDVFYNEDIEVFYTLTQYYDIYSPVVQTTTVQKDYTISLYGSGNYYLMVYGFNENEDYTNLNNWNSSHLIFNETSSNLSLISGDTYNGFTRRYKTFNTNKKYLGVRITLVTAGNGSNGSRVAHIQIEEGTEPLAYNTGSSAISSKITQTAEQIIVDVKDLLINGDVTINGLITNVSGHINQHNLTSKDAVVVDFVNNKNFTIENINGAETLPLSNNGQIVYLPYYDSMYNDNLSSNVSTNPTVSASEFGFTANGFKFQDSGINFTVPVYKTEGTQVRISNSFIPTLNNWQNYAQIYANANASTKLNLYRQLLENCVILCADPRIMTYRNFKGYWNSSLSGIIFNTGYGQQTSTTNIIEPSHSGAFLYNGLRSRFLLLLPSQSVNLRSQIINYGNGRKVLNWLVETTADIKPISTGIGLEYGNTLYANYYNSVLGGSSWQTQYTQTNDIILGNAAIDANNLGTQAVFPVIKITNNTISTNGYVPYVRGYETL